MSGLFSGRLAPLRRDRLSSIATQKGNHPMTQKSQAAESAILEATFVALIRSMTDEQLLLFCRKAKSIQEAARLDALDR
jgi:hypothetical protein